MCLDWHGPQETHRHVSSGADTLQASPGRPKPSPTARDVTVRSQAT